MPSRISAMITVGATVLPAIVTCAVTDLVLGLSHKASGIDSAIAAGVGLVASLVYQLAKPIK